MGCQCGDPEHHTLCTESVRKMYIVKYQTGKKLQIAAQIRQRLEEIHITTSTYPLETLSAMSLNKRVKIRAPKRNLNESVDIEKSWKVLSFAISEIVNKNASQLSFERLYRKCYHLVLRKHGEHLYINVKKQLTDHLVAKQARLMEEIYRLQSMSVSTTANISAATASASSGSTSKSAAINGNNFSNTFNSDILTRINKEWEDHCLCMRMISDVLMYLDRVYVKESSLPLVYDVGITLFKDCVIEYNSNAIGNILNNLLMNGIANNRKGRLVDKFLIKSIIKMYESLSDEHSNLSTSSSSSTPSNNNNINPVSGANDYEENYYLKSFEPYFMQQSYGYYLNLSNELIKLENGMKYITRVNEIIIEEENMSVIYLPKVTLPKLIQLLDGILISNNISKAMGFQDQGFDFWIMNDKYEQLSLLHSLISRVDKNFHLIQSSLKKIIFTEGSALEAKVRENLSTNGKIDTNKPKKKSLKENLTQFAVEWIQAVLNFKEKFDSILEKGFDRNITIQAAIESAFVDFLNQNSKIGEYLSLFIDNSIKKSSKNKTEEECEKVLDRALVVFKYIRDKDLFEKYYKNHLTRRLLQQKYMSIDIERSMISKLRQELGSLYTSKLEGMFRDMKVSKDLSVEFNLKYQESEGASKSKKINFEALILTTTFWPLQPNKEAQEVTYPVNLEKIKTEYEQFYLSKHKGRNISWAPTFGSVDIRTRYNKRIYEINMPTYAAIILLLFEKQDTLTFEEVQEQTSIPKNDLIRHLQSISVAPRTRLLKKAPMSKEINPGDQFSINENFESNTSKIKVLTVSTVNKVENDDERKETMENVKDSRKFEIDAAVVRIMKSRKSFKHNELMAEIIKQLNNRFYPSPQFIKQRIESLLEREYLARDQEDKGVYIYLA